MIAKLLKSVAALLGLGALVYLALPHLICVEAPERQMLADCKTNQLAFTMPCDYSPPYAFVLGVSQSSPEPLTFHGELIIRQHTGIVAAIQVGCDRLTSCNWLPGLQGYILTWGRRNAAEPSLSELLHRGQTYDVSVAFSEAPPADSSLWFSSMRRAKIW